MLHYLNDFFIVFSFDIDIKFHKTQFKLICDFLNLHQNVTKKDFDTILEFLDILMNSMIMKIKFFKEKLEKTIKLIVVALSNRSFFQKKLEQLIDFLVFCAKIMISDRFFLISFHKALNRRFFYYYINNVMRADFF